jgi:hypothetical protein
VQLVTIAAAAPPLGPAITVDSSKTKVSRLSRSFLRFFFMGGSFPSNRVRGGYFFLMSFGALAAGALFTAVFLGFLVSFFRALLPLAMIAS